MFDDTLLKKMKILAAQEKKVKEFKRRIRVKGKIIKKSKTKNDNIKLRVQKGDSEYNFIIIKTHKERFAISEGLSKGDYVHAEGVNKFRAVICTKIKRIAKPDESRQMTLY